MFDEKELTSSETLEKIKLAMADYIGEDSFREAFDLSQVLIKSISNIKDFRKRYGSLYNEYERIIIRLRWVGMPIMTGDEVAEMFSGHFKEIFNIPDFDLWAKLRHALMGLHLLEDRDKLKKRLRDTLMNSQERITSLPLKIDGIERPPTIGNWMVDYNKKLGGGKVEELARTQYLVNSPSIKVLGEEEKRRIKTLFDLYEKLKLSSLDLEGLEEDIPVDEDSFTGYLKQGVLEPVFKETERQKMIWKMAQDFIAKRDAERNGGIQKSPSNKEEFDVEDLKELMAQYPAGSLERRAIEEEIRKLSAKSAPGGSSNGIGTKK